MPSSTSNEIITLRDKIESSLASSSPCPLDASSLNEILSRLDHLVTSLDDLKLSKIGKTMTSLKCKTQHQDIKTKAASLITKWKTIAAKAKTHDEITPSSARGDVTPSGNDNTPKTTTTTTEQQEELTNPAVDPFPGQLCDDSRRNNYRCRLWKALWNNSSSSLRSSSSLSEAAQRVVAIEDACWRHHTSQDDPTNKQYANQLKMIDFNLKDRTNMDFNERIFKNVVTPQQVAEMSSADMASDEKKEEREKDRKSAAEASESDWALRNNTLKPSTQFVCGKCKKRKTSFHQLQTRSSDEPMTTFVLCLECGNRWKF